MVEVCEVRANRYGGGGFRYLERPKATFFFFLSHSGACRRSDAFFSPPAWDKEVLRKGFDVDSQPVGPLKITLGKPITIRGKIVDAEGQPLAETMIFLTSPAGSGRAVSDAEGGSIERARAWEYRVYVVPDQNEDLATDPDYLKEHASDLPVVRVVDGENPPVVVHWTRGQPHLGQTSIAITSWSAIGGVVVSTHEPAWRHRALASLTKNRTLRAFVPSGSFTRTLCWPTGSTSRNGPLIIIGFEMLTR